MEAVDRSKQPVMSKKDVVDAVKVRRKEVSVLSASPSACVLR